MDVNSASYEGKIDSNSSQDSSLQGGIKFFGIKGGEKLGILKKDTVNFTSTHPKEAPASSKELEAKVRATSKRYTPDGKELYWVETRPEMRASLAVGKLAAQEGDAALKMGNYQEVFESFSRAINNGYRTPTTYHKKAYSEYMLGRYEDSIKDYTMALNIKSPLENTSKCRADAKMKLRSTLSDEAIRGKEGKSLLSSAIKDYEDALSVKRRFTTLDALAFAYCQTGDRELIRKACNCFRESIPKHEHLLGTYNDELKAAKTEAEKKAAAKKIAAERKTIGGLYYRLGVYSKKGEMTQYGKFDDESFTCLKKSTEYGHPMTADKSFRLGLVAPTHEERLSYLRAAVEMNPGVAAYHKGLAQEIETRKGAFDTPEEKKSYIWAMSVMQEYSCTPTTVSKEDLDKAKEILQNYSSKQKDIEFDAAQEELEAYFIESSTMHRQTTRAEEAVEKKTLMGA